MTKFTAAQKKRFEKEIGELATRISKLAETVETTNAPSDAVQRAFGHLQASLVASHQRCAFAAQTNDAGSFSLDGPAPAALLAPSSGIATSEGRLARDGNASLPETRVETSADGEAMIMV